VVEDDVNCTKCGAPNSENSLVCASCGAQFSTGASAHSQPVSEVAKRLRPMGVGDILDQMIRLYRQNFRLFVTIVGLVYVPITVLQIVVLIAMGPEGLGFSALMNPGARPAAPSYSVPSISLIEGVVSSVLNCLMLASLMSAASHRYLGADITVREAYRLGWSSFWRMLCNSLLFVVIMLLLTITVIGIPFAIFFTVRWILASQIVVVEGKGPWSALGRSSQLVKGSWWRICGIFVLAIVSFYIIVVIPAAVFGGVFVGGAILVAREWLFAAYIVNSLISSLFSLLAYPILILPGVLVYYDQRVRKEGFDLELLAGDANIGSATIGA
jgi:hypothetical protein